MVMRPRLLSGFFISKSNFATIIIKNLFSFILARRHGAINTQLLFPTIGRAYLGETRCGFGEYPAIILMCVVRCVRLMFGNHPECRGCVVVYRYSSLGSSIFR